MRNLRLVHSSTWLEHPTAADTTAVDVLETSGPGQVERQPALMEGNVPPLDPAVHAILGHVRIVSPLPQVIRARAIARARAAIAAMRC